MVLGKQNVRVTFTEDMLEFNSLEPFSWSMILEMVLQFWLVCFPSGCSIYIKQVLSQLLIFRCKRTRGKQSFCSMKHPRVLALDMALDDTSFNGLSKEAPYERGTFFRLQVYED